MNIDTATTPTADSSYGAYIGDPVDIEHALGKLIQ